MIQGTRGELLSVLSEIVGYKSGVALDEWDITNRLPFREDLLMSPNEQEIELADAEFEMYVRLLLHAVGNVGTTTPLLSSEALLAKCGQDAETRRIVHAIPAMWAKAIQEIFRRQPSGSELAFEEFYALAEREF